MENEYNLLWKLTFHSHQKSADWRECFRKVFREVCMDDSEPSATCLSSKAHNPFDGISHKLLFYSFMSSLEPCALLWLITFLHKHDRQMGPWKKRWKNKKLAVFISEENRVWTSKWRIRDNRDECTCHQLVNQWWRKKKLWKGAHLHSGQQRHHPMN